MPKIPKTNQEIPTLEPTAAQAQRLAPTSEPEGSSQPGAEAVPVPAPSPLGSYRTQLEGLAERLGRLRGLQQECELLRSDQDSQQSQRQELLQAIVHKTGRAPRAELEGQLRQLGVKQEICATELDFAKQQLELEEVELQQHLIHMNSELEKLWRAWLTFVQPREYAAIEQCVHSEFRAQQKLMIEQLMMVSVGVIECRKLEPTLLSVATTYLYDTPAHKFSEGRPQTVRLVIQETERILGQTEKLFSAIESLLQLGMTIPTPQPFEPRPRREQETAWPEPGQVDADDLMHYKPQPNVGTTIAPAPMPATSN